MGWLFSIDLTSEPTSGLDGQSAFNIVRFLRKLAAAGQTILCTIHQPNAILFENFDRLLLLQRGGQTVYFGDIGKDSHVLVDYLERNGAPVPKSANPAEFMLEAIGAGSGRMLGDGTNWHQKWLQSPELAKTKEDIIRFNDEASKKPEEKDAAALRAFSTSFGFQLKTILRRTNVALWRNADYQWTRLFSHISIAVITGLTFLQLDNSLTSLQYRVFAIFLVTVLPALVSRLFIEKPSSLHSHFFSRRSWLKSNRSSSCPVEFSTERLPPKCTPPSSSPPVKCSRKCLTVFSALSDSGCPSTTSWDSQPIRLEPDTSSLWSSLRRSSRSLSDR